MADRGFCSFAHLALLMAKGVHAVFRLHQKQIVDFTPGRAHARPGQKRAPKGMPRSRWIRACGLMDQVVEYFKPARSPGVDERGGVPGVARVDPGAGAAVSDRGAGVPDARGDAGDDAARRRGLPGRCAGGTLWDEVAGGGESEVA